MAKKVYLVGIGPGDEAHLTLQARAALEDAQALCGYTVYVDLVSGLFPGKKTYTTPMRGELERCRWALETAAGGETVALVCSGDAGVYGLASPVLQLAPQWPGVDVEVIPGVTAALSGAAVLGAPIGHDFCIISLSDLLTPWEAIEKRLRCAAEGDFSICIYNPSSHMRKDHLKRACDILLSAGKHPQTVCGYVRNIGRPGEERRIVPLEALRTAAVDMFTTVYIGSSATQEDHGWMITPRGYRGEQSPCAL